MHVGQCASITGGGGGPGGPTGGTQIAWHVGKSVAAGSVLTSHVFVVVLQRYFVEGGTAQAVLQAD